MFVHLLASLICFYCLKASQFRTLAQDIVPITYDLHIIAPLQDETLSFQGKLTIVVKCVSKTNLVEFNSKNLKIATSSVSIYAQSEPETKLKIENFLESEKDETAGIKLDKDLQTGTTYVIELTQFTGKINPPYSYGMFFVDLAPSTFIYCTQFQMNFARTVFPCFDQPNLKARFTLTLEHPPDIQAISNMKVKSIESTNVGWHRTNFLQSPKMSTYTLAFVLIPRFLSLNITGKSVNGVNLTLHYNKFRTNANDVQKYFNIAKYSMDFYENLFTLPQPIEKLDFIIVPKFAIFGMENWGMIVLSEEFLSKNEEQEIVSLIAHEIAHQWFGNLVTNFDWTFLCLQEGLAEHYTRKVVKSYYAERNSAFVYDKYITARYITAMLHETDNNELLGALQTYKTLAEAGNFCFGKSPFVFDMVENILGQSTFDERIDRFLTNFVFDSYKFTDLLKYFESAITPAAIFMKFWSINGGYPSLFVEENGRISQKQLVKQPFREVDQIWPIPITFKSFTDTDEINGTWLMTKNFTWPGFPRPIGHWYLINEDFQFFYRVNYDHYNWYLLSEQILKNNSDFHLITQIQLISDFCFFSNLGFVDKFNSHISRINVLEAVKRLQLKSGLRLELYFQDC